MDLYIHKLNTLHIDKEYSHSNSPDVDIHSELRPHSTLYRLDLKPLEDILVLKDRNPLRHAHQTHLKWIYLSRSEISF